MQGEGQQREAKDKPSVLEPEKMRDRGPRLFFSFGHLWVLPCLIVAALWIGSYAPRSAPPWGPLYHVTSDPGYFTVKVYGGLPHGKLDDETRRLSSAGRMQRGERYWGGLDWWFVYCAEGLAYCGSDIRGSYEVTIRYRRLWMVTLLGLIPWVRWIWHVRQQIRLSRIGLCSTCGYDLRASTERCPECGTPIPAGITVSVIQ